MENEFFLKYLTLVGMMKMRKNGAEIPDQGFHPCEDKLAAVLKVDAGQLMELEEGKIV